MEFLQQTFPDRSHRDIEAAMNLTNHNTNVAGMVLISKTRKTIISFNKQLNKLGFFAYHDTLTYIYQFLDLRNKIILNKVCMLLKTSLSQIYNKLIQNPKKLVHLIDTNWTRDDYSLFAQDPQRQLVWKIYNKQIQLHNEIPKEHKAFIQCVYDLSLKIPYISIRSYEHLLLEIHLSKIRLNKGMKLFSKYYGMGYEYIVSYVNDGSEENKYFVSKMGGENGYAARNNDNVYESTKLNDLKTLTFNEALIEVFKCQNP